MGMAGEAVGGATFPNGDRVVIGNIFDSSWWGVLWRMPAMGGWGMPVALCQDAEQSWVSAAHYCGDDVGLGVAGTAFEGGRWLAVLHFITPTDVLTVDLPSPPGSNAAALGLYCEDGITWAVGRVTDRQGRMRPALWANAGQGWSISLIDLPNGVQGQATGVVTIGAGTWAICGDAMRGGRTTGFTSTIIDGHEEQHGFLSPLAGYMNSSADSLSTDGGVIFGRSMNPGGEPVATGWIGGFPFPAQQLLREPGSVAEVRSVLPNDSSFGQLYGQIVATPGGQPQACVFPAINAHVPDRINLALGTIVGFNNDGFPDFLWHDDDNNLRIRAERSGAMLKAVVDLQFTPLAGPSMSSAIQYNLIARADGVANTGGGTLNVHAFNFASQSWVPSGSFQLTSVYSGESGALNGVGFVNPQNGAVRLRLEFIANGNRPTALVLDEVQTYMDNPH
jgi:hypothetical protein